MISLGSIILLAAHLLCMNVCSAGPLLCVWLLRRPHQDAETRHLAARLAAWCLLLLFAGVAIGLAVGLLALMSGDRRLIDVVPLFADKIAWGVAELLCSVLWLVGYWAWLKWKPPQSRLARFFHATLAILSATNMLYHFPSLLTVMSMAASGEYSFTEPVDAAEFRLLAYTPNVIAHTLHFWWASLAVSGVFLFWLVPNQEEAKRFYVLGARFALAATVLQIPTGFWLLLVTPPAPQSKLLGGNGIATTLFAASLFCVFYLLQFLGTLALGETSEKLANRCASLLVITVVLMTGTLHFLRS